MKGTMLLSLLLFHILMTGMMSDLSSDRAALLSLRSSVGGRTLFWKTTTDQNPCNWSGVQCDSTPRVTALHLPGVSLSGEFPFGIFGNLTMLQTVSLRFNALSGSIPSDLSSCTRLRNLYLQGNRFSGDFPDVLFTSLPDLVRLNLAGNNFSGPISTAFNNFTRLKTLYLENNQFSGSIPDLNIPNLQQFNVSFNNLNGSIPRSLQSKPRDSFLGNSLCGSPFDELCPSTEDVPPAVSVDFNRNRNKKKHGLSGGAIAGIVIGSVLGLVVILLLLFIFCRKRTTKKTSSIDIGVTKLTDPEILGEKPLTSSGTGSNGFSVAAAAAAAMTTSGNAGGGGGGGDTSGNKKLVFFRNSTAIFDLEDLLRASAEVLGKGTFGTAYKAVLEAGIMVAVKRLKDVTVSEPEFREKIEFVGAMDHDNLVPLRAYYYSKEEKLLVYDYMPMGSLSALLHGLNFFPFISYHVTRLFVAIIFVAKCV